MANLIGELVFSIIFEFTDMIEEENLAPEAKHRHFYYWGGWLSCLLVLGLTVLLLVGTVLSLIKFMKDPQAVFLILALALFAISLTGLWRLYKSIRTIFKVTLLYFGKKNRV